MSKKDQWYLVAYDIRDDRRLRRVHRLLRRRALPVQKSVFFYQGHEGKLRHLLDEVAELMDLCQDDLRAWPVDRLGEAWLYGEGQDTGEVLPAGAAGWLRRWWQRWVA